MSTSADRIRVLYVSDLTYQAKGRRYSDEDIHLSARIGEDFDLAICHPLAAEQLMGTFDVVVIRNSGPVIHYLDAYDAFRSAALAQKIPVFPELTGKADQAGKQYLLDLFAADYPVIPTVDNAADISRLPTADEFVAKPKRGADSVGLTFVTPDALPALNYDDLLVQPRVDFQYEASFYFVDREPQYALNAPSPDKRWQLQPYRASKADWSFAQQFIDWNTIEHGIQRVDACRTQDGDLLLVELEDLNPYLSLDLVDTETHEAFVSQLKRSISELARSSG